VPYEIYAAISYTEYSGYVLCECTHNHISSAGVYVAMPPKKKKAGKGKAAKKKKDTPEDQNKTTCNRFLKSYIKHCNEQSVLSCAAILQECRRCIEEDQLINKV